VNPWAVEARELTRTFGAFVAVNRVSFSVAPGEIFGFLGSNGAGKTTTIRMLCGLLPPSSGRATVLGFDITTQALHLRRQLGYMSQKFSLYTDLTVVENLEFWGSAYGLAGPRLRKAVENGLDQSQLWDHQHLLVRELPLGFRQRLALAATLLHQPKLVFLDEPTSGVDPEARRDFWEIIDALSGQGVTVFVTTHTMDEAERCHRVALMHAGKLLALDTVANLKALIPSRSLVALEASDPGLALQVLGSLPHVEDAALFGTTIHCLLRQPHDLQQLLVELPARGVVVHWAKPAEPSLEDVFVFVIKKAEQEGGKEP